MHGNVHSEQLQSALSRVFLSKKHHIETYLKIVEDKQITYAFLNIT